MIKELNDLIHFVKTSVWRDEELLAFLSKNDRDLLHLYRTVWSNSTSSDCRTAQAAGISQTSYKKQARLLRKQLRKMTIFFSDEKAKTDATVKNFIEGTLEIALLNLLAVRGYRQAPLAIAKRLYRRGHDYDMPHFVVEALRIMKESVLSVGGSTALFEKYSDEYWEFRNYTEAEERAADCFQRTRLPGFQQQGQRDKTPRSMQQSLQILEGHKGSTPSYLFHVYYYTLCGSYLLGLANYEAALNNYEEAISYLRTRRYPVGNSMAMFFYSKIPACIALGRFEEGEAAVLASLDFAPNGSFNFFNAHEMYFYLAMHAGNYEQALEIYQTSTRHRRFSGLRLPQRETWHILGAYLFVLFRLSGKPAGESALPPYRSYRFANETPIHGRDKSGINVAIRIVFNLMLLIEDRKDALLESAEALDKYRSRYLRDMGAERSDLFIQILLQLPKTGFYLPAFLEKIQPLQQKLKSAKPRTVHLNYELEIIPFEKLLELLTGYLERCTQ